MSLDLGEIYKLAYDNRGPFEGNKNIGKFFSTYIKQVISDTYNLNDVFQEGWFVGPLDVFFALVKEANININDVTKGIERWYEKIGSTTKLDKLLFINYSNHPFFGEYKSIFENNEFAFRWR